jgi:hypothetical protein
MSRECVSGRSSYQPKIPSVVARGIMIKINLKEIGWQDLDWIHLAQTREKSWGFVLSVSLTVSHWFRNRHSLSLEVRFSETSMDFYRTIRRYISDDNAVNNTLLCVVPLAYLIDISLFNDALST